MSLRKRLLLWYTGVLAVCGFFLIVSLYWLTSHQMKREADKFLNDEMNEWARICSVTAKGELESALRLDMTGERYFPLICRVYDPVAKKNIILLGSSRRLAAIQDTFPPAPERGWQTSHAALDSGRRELRLSTGAIPSGDYKGMVLQGGIYIRRLNDRLQKLRAYSALAFVAMVLLALSGGWVLSGRSLKPVQDLAAGLEKVESESLSWRFPSAAGADEVAQLQAALNRMLDRLQAAFDRLGRFSADAAHELRTPLASLQCRLEVALNQTRSEEEYRYTISDALSETAGLTRMVNNLMFLARVDAHAETGQFGPVALDETLAEAQELFAAAAEAKGIRLKFSAGDKCLIHGDPILLRRLMGNLIDNALRYTPLGGEVEVQARSEAGKCILSVRDTGIGISREAQAHIFDRFYRTEQARQREARGAGLGLNICQSIATLHGADIRVESDEGKGAMFEVHFPRLKD